MTAAAVDVRRPLTAHVLKSWPGSFSAIFDGRKRFELRRDDRGGFQVGDLLVLHEWDPDRQAHTGAINIVRVTHIADVTDGGTPDVHRLGYALLSIQNVTVHDA